MNIKEQIIDFILNEGFKYDDIIASWVLDKLIEIGNYVYVDDEIPIKEAYECYLLNNKGIFFNKDSSKVLIGYEQNGKTIDSGITHCVELELKDITLDIFKYEFYSIENLKL